MAESGTTTGGVPDAADEIYAFMPVGTQQSMMALYTIPNGKTGVVLDVWSSPVRAASGDRRITTHVFAREENGVFRCKGEWGGSTQGDHGRRAGIGVPLLGTSYPAKTDFELRCTDTSSSNTGVTGGFLILLVDD